MATSKPTQDIADWASGGTVASSIPPAEVQQGQQLGKPVPAGWLNLFGQYLDFLRSGGGEVFFAPSGLSWGATPMDVTPAGLSTDIHNNTGTGNYDVDGVSSPANVPGTVESITITFGSVTSVSSGVTIEPYIFWIEGGILKSAQLGDLTPSSGASELTANFASGTANIGGPWTLVLQVFVDDGDRVDIAASYVTLS